MVIVKIISKILVQSFNVSYKSGSNYTVKRVKEMYIDVKKAVYKTEDSICINVDIHV